jgi:hypothetical protein
MGTGEVVFDDSPTSNPKILTKTLTAGSGVDALPVGFQNIRARS